MSNDHVVVEITVDNVGITRQGFGKPIILSHSADWAERVRSYSSLPGVGEDFDSDTPEYLSANAFFAQTPKPPSIMIGRVDADVTQQYTITMDQNGPRDEFVYEIEVSGTGMETETISYTSDEDATEDEILNNLATQLNGKADKTYTAVFAANASDPATLVVTADDPNVWFSLCLGNFRALSIAQTHAEADIDDDLSEILLEDSSWYEVHTMFNSSAYVQDVAAWVSANERIYVWDTCDTDVIKVAAGMGDDVGTDMLDSGYSSSMGSFYPCPAEMFSAAWMGRWLPTDPGRATAKFKTLEGPPTVSLNDTEKANIRARRMNSYTREFSRPITWEGQVFSTIYKFLDVRRDVDWLSDEVTKEVFGILAGSDIVPYTPAGVAKVEGGVRGRMLLAETRGVLLEGNSAVEAPPFEDIDSADKSDRVLRNVRASGTLAGAIHAVIPISITVTF